MEDIMAFFKTVILLQLFYAVSITMISHSLPADSYNYVLSFSEVGDNINFQGVSDEVKTALEKQSKVGVIELGALVFYSGNILIDLLVNFATAVPQMFGLIINGFAMLFPIDVIVTLYIEIFITVVIMVIYFISLMQLLTSVRSGTRII